jgi:hypothetical protein
MAIDRAMPRVRMVACRYRFTSTSRTLDAAEESTHKENTPGLAGGASTAALMIPSAVLARSLSVG